MVCLSLGTSAQEVACALALLVALSIRRLPPADLLQPLLAVVTLSVVASLGAGSLREGISVGWALCLVAALPLLPGDRDQAARWGVAAAAVAGTGALLWAILGGGWPAQGPYSHHLTLGYALLPPCAVALHRGWRLAALGCAVGVVATVSLGPALGLVVVLVGVRLSPGVALLGGAVASLVLLAVLHGEPAVAERAVLWASGAELLVDNPIGVGPGADRAALSLSQQRLLPGFHFPLHAHDAALQRGAEVGWAGWLVWAWLLSALWKRATPGGRAGIAAVVVGGLTQDTLGDLEVCRSVCAWALLCEPVALCGVGREDDTKSVILEA
ncbi:MAG: hypothetical protein ACI8S6_003231 [Myxococcota bacterium]|jgi:hypothetical protein